VVFIDGLEQKITETLRLAIDTALLRLTERERRVIYLVHGFNQPKLSFVAIGKELGVTGERVRQIKVVATRRLKHPGYNQLIRNVLINEGILKSPSPHHCSGYKHTT
jgi:DNA-directed RNA polymerase sigma subunit (sigma70/sigma32)